MTYCFQSVYIYFSGHGTQEYFTAPNDMEAREFVAKERKLDKYSSCYQSIIHVQAQATFWLRNGITISNPTDEGNIIAHIVKELS